ncbi:MAG: NAD(P)-dependent oxidoreductase [Nitrospirae bacterium]|nr:NAD(P)-dependent oxidoreductase [Nitrospirota bacterium]
MKVLITGGRSLLGKALVQAAPGEYGLHATYFQHPPSDAADGVRYHQLDLRDAAQIASLASQARPDILVHVASLGDVDYCERNPQEAWDVNVRGTAELWNACARLGCRMTYVSSNAVFDGNSAPYTEKDPCHPTSHYGRTKRVAEELVQSLDPATLVIRPNLLFGWNHPDHRPNPVTSMLGKLATGDRVEAVDDIFNNPVSAEDCAVAIWRAIRQRCSGTIHVGGRDRLSRYAFLSLAARVFEFGGDVVAPVSSSRFPSLTPRPRDTTYRTERMESELGLSPALAGEGLSRMKALAPHPARSAAA